MSFFHFIKSKAILLCVQALGALFVLTILLLVNMDTKLVLLFYLGWFLLLISWLTIEYRYHKYRMVGLQKQANELKEKYLLGELLEAPKNMEEAEYYYIMKEITSSAIQTVERERKEKQDYCDYVTAWVHEIKTPLTTASLILSNGGDVTKLRRELKRADNLTDSILYYARLRTAEKDLQIVKTNLNEIVKEAVLGEMELLIAAGISVEVNGEMQVYTDAKLLIFVLKQFLINCAKYCKGCKIGISLIENQLIFEDNGPGIPPEEITRVTERGFTGRSYRESSPSTGIGLYIANQLCNQMNITLSITSVVNEFTRITLTFPNLTKL